MKTRVYRTQVIKMGLKPANLWDTTIRADPEDVGVGGVGRDLFSSLPGVGGEVYF